MRMRKRKTFLVTLMTLFTGLSLATTSFAWFSTILNFHSDMRGSSISTYFAGGTGTAADPYLLSAPQHVYNLSWLQNSGTFPNKTYFELTNSIDMRGALAGFASTTSGAVPPIGTDTHPFIGTFDGNGYTIKNL